MRDPANWMLSEAIDALARAERMHRQLFQLQRSQARAPAWEPPLDMIETDGRARVVPRRLRYRSAKENVLGDQCHPSGPRTNPETYTKATRIAPRWFRQTKRNQSSPSRLTLLYRLDQSSHPDALPAHS